MSYSIEPIGFVRSERKDPIDDDWASVSAWIELAEGISEESLLGLEAFSHLEILYLFHLADPARIVMGAEHPRENPAWPRVGIFAQRKRLRPNLIGATIVELEKVEGRRIYARLLDAIDGSPVIDIKPVFREYLPQGELRQPQWSVDLMKGYW